MEGSTTGADLRKGRDLTCYNKLGTFGIVWANFSSRILSSGRGKISPAPVALLYLNRSDLVKFTGTLKKTTNGAKPHLGLIFFDKYVANS